MIDPKLIKKRVGTDYVVTVLHVTEGLFPVTVFGCENEEQAKRDALSSFTGRDYDLVSVHTIEKL